MLYAQLDILKYANNYIFPPKNFSISRTFHYFCSKKENMNYNNKNEYG